MSEDHAHVVALARELVGGRTTVFGWGGRPRAVIRDTGVRSRFRGALLTPAFRTPTRVFRAVSALRHAALAEGRDETATPPDLPPALEELVTVAAFIGTPGHAQKLTLPLMDASGRTRAVLKVAATTRGDASVVREADALRDARLARFVPELLWSGRLLDRQALATEHVAGRTGASGPRGVQEALAVLPVPEEDGPEFAAADHPWVRAFSSSGGVVPPPPPEGGTPARWPVVRIHGDLAPWNLIRRPDGSVVAIDWESSEARGLQGVDLAHHVVADALWLRRRRPEDAAADAVACLIRHLDFDAPTARWVVRLTALRKAAHQREIATTNEDRRTWERIAGWAAT